MGEMVQIKKEQQGDLCCDSDGPRYPYGTCLRLSDELVDQLNLLQLSLGDEVEIIGKAYVESRSEYESESENHNSSEKTVGLQFTEIKVKHESKRVDALYGGD